jgi:serine protease Do
VGEEGLVMTSLALFNPAIPDEQMKEFKIIVPRDETDDLELDAVFLGRDERTGLAFVRTKDKQSWPAVKFVEKDLAVGDRVRSVGILPKNAGYTAYLTEGTVSANLRGATPTSVVMGGGLAAMGSPVFNDAGEAIGFVNAQPEQEVFLNDERNALAPITDPPNFFVPARDFAWSLQDLPTEGTPMPLPWMGVVQLSGLEKDVAEFFGLTDQPAVEVGEVVPDGPAEKAGLKRGDKIIALNGQPLERGDLPEELPGILTKHVRRMKPGTEVTLSVVRTKGEPPQEVKLTLEEQPKRANLARRYFAEDIGFSVRELVFSDLYARKLKPDFQGVMTSFIKPQSAAASGDLKMGDLITEVNGTAITDVDQFRQTFEQVRKDKPRDALKLVVLRQGNTQVIRIEPPQ